MVLPQSDLAIADNFIPVYGAELHYLEAGNGTLVILLHGLVETACQWHQVMERLAKHSYVIALDQIGFGYSSKPLLNYRIGTLVDFLYGFYQALDIQQASLVGAGIGGWVAVALALQYPALVKHLVLANPMLENSAQVELPTSATREQTRLLLQRLFYAKDHFANEQAVDKLFTQQVMLNDGYTKQRLIESINRDEDTLCDRISKLAVPTLLVHSRDDELTPLATSETLLQQIRGSQLKIIDRCGHLPHIEQPEELSAAVLQFLKIG